MLLIGVNHFRKVRPKFHSNFGMERKLLSMKVVSGFFTFIFDSLMAIFGVRRRRQRWNFGVYNIKEAVYANRNETLIRLRNCRRNFKSADNRTHVGASRGHYQHQPNTFQYPVSRITGRQIQVEDYGGLRRGKEENMQISRWSFERQIEWRNVHLTFLGH